MRVYAGGKKIDKHRTRSKLRGIWGHANLSIRVSFLRFFFLGIATLPLPPSTKEGLLLRLGHAPSQKCFKFKVLEIPFPAFSAGNFQLINTQGNEVLCCLFYPSLVLSVRYNVNGKKTMQ